MTINLFGPPSKNDIKVAYIDPILGLVEGVTICQANDYAIKEPGTTFIFRNGNQTLQYLNINEVNRINPNDLITTDECGGISQKKECGSPTIQIFGGGGIGAAGNPIVGNDGAILAVDIIRGGNGYQYPPLVSARDICNYGSGATFTTVIGEIVETTETYDNESDFEDYELCDPTDVGYGRRYGPNGEDLGPWDPRVYTNLGQDPIRKEIDEFQEIVRRLGRKPFFSSIKNKPTNIFCSDVKVIPQVYDVRTKWGPESFNPNEFMSSHAISPVSPSNVPGSDFAGRLFTFEWTEDFPTDGEYIFRMLGDNLTYLYIDNLLITSRNNTWGSTSKGGAIEPVIPVQKTIRKGIHKVRVDLLNLPFYENRITTPQAVVSANIITTPQVVVSANIINVNFKFFGNPAASFRHNYKITELGIDVFKPSKTQVNKNVIGKCESGKVYEVEFFRNGSPGGTIIQRSDSFIEYEDLGKPPLDASISIDKGKFFNIRGNKCSFVVGALLPPPPTTAVATPAQSASVSSTGLEIAKVGTQSNIEIKKVFNTIDFISKANRTLWRIDPSLHVGQSSVNLYSYGVSPFDPLSEAAKTESFAGIHPIVWDNINFPIDGNYRIKMYVDDNVILFIGEEEIRYNGFTSLGKPSPEFNQIKFFKAGNYKIRAELEQIPSRPLSGGNPMALAIDIDIPTVTETIISRKSWNENAMGVALTIDAPEPTIPQEPIPEQEGRCPNNPIWSTRFPGAKEFWYPVRYSEALRANGITEWSGFFSRYAISPVKPLDIPGSDAGGILFTTSWDIDIPYDGFYQFAVQRDETARIFVDGNLAFDIKTAGDDIWRDFRNKPKFQKVFISRGRHTIGIELEQRSTEAFDQVSQKIFRTLDWQVESANVEIPFGSLFVKEGDSYYILIGGNDIVEIDFVFDWYEDESFGGYAVTKITIPTETGPTVVLSRPLSGMIGSSKATGSFRADKKYGPIIFEGRAPGSRDPEIIDTGSAPENRQQRIIFWDAEPGDLISNAQVTAVTARQLSPGRVTGGLTSGIARDGVTYEGPALTSYVPGFISPVFQNVLTPTDEIQGKTWIMNWKNVNFPEDGVYNLTTKADDLVIIRVDGAEVGRHNLAVDGENFKQSSFNATKGRRTLQLELSNLSFPNTGFSQNPVFTSVEIRKNISVLREGSSKSWVENPIAISAILIPPPCPRRIRGRGIVTDVIVNDPGNGYLPPIALTTTPPSALTLIQTDVPGVPGSGAGAGAGGAAGAPGVGLGAPGVGLGAPGVGLGAPGVGLGAPAVPLSIPSPPSGPPTGINALFRPQFEVVRDPVVIDPQKLLQVTDLVGLKQTGYVNGRAYYGAVYYDRGIRYAGFYETVGEPIQVYDTLRESILAQVITPPSAILRQGTDIRSNNPLLNIPGTVQSTLSSNSIVGAGDISTPSVPFVPEPVSDPTYPVSLRLKSVLVENSGINYNVTDQIRVIPSNGAILEPVFGSFGRVIRVAVIDPGFGFTEYPRIEMFTPL